MKFPFFAGFVPPRFDLARQCIECRAQQGPGATPCQGFGVGCLQGPAAKPAEPQPPKP